MFQQNFNNGNFVGGYNMPQGTGYQFNGMQPSNAPVIKNFLTNEEIAKLMQKESVFSLALTEDEALRAKCNHRSQDGIHDAIVEDPVTGVCRCTICGYEFEPIDQNTTADTLNEYVKNVLDILQTIKMLYFDMPAEVAGEFFKVIPLLEKVPKLFERACQTYSKYADFNAYGYNNKNMNTVAMFNMLSSVLGGQPQAQPFMNPPAGQPQAAPQQPYFGQPMMGYQQPVGMFPGSNGFVANGYMPQTAGFQYDPTQQAPDQAQTTAPAADKTVEVKKTVKA